LRLVNHDAHDFLGLAQPAQQLLLVLLDIDGLLRDPALHGGLGHGGGHPDQHSLIEGLGDDVLAAESHVLDSVGAPHGVGHVLLASAAKARVPPASSRRDGRSAHIERAPEDGGKPSTLFTWFGKSDRPVAMMASGRAAVATS